MLSEEKELRYLGVDFVNLMFARILRPTSNFGLLPPGTCFPWRSGSLLGSFAPAGKQESGTSVPINIVLTFRENPFAYKLRRPQ